MKLFFLILLLATGQHVHAQVEFLDTLETASSPIQLPLRVDSAGQLFFLETPSKVMFGPSLGASYSNKTTEYNFPVRLSEVDSLISPIRPGQKWLNIRKRRYDGGMGITMIFAKFFNAGLIPFKGAMQTIMRVKDNKGDAVDPDISLPRALKDLESWSVGDQGSYQTYGGVEAMLSFGVDIINLAKTSVAFQNQFVIELHKIDAKTVVFTIAEEKLGRSETSVGPLISKGKLAFFRGNRASFEFILDLSNPAHHILYELGLKGKINQLQKALNDREQKLKWVGSSKSFYLGIPYFIGVEKSRGDYNMTSNGVETDLNVQKRQSRGIFSTVGDHDRMVFRTENSVVLFWSSQITKAKEDMMEKYFFRIGRWIGLRGFEGAQPRGMYGSVMSQVGLTFVKDEFMALKNIRMELIDAELSERCSLMRMKCEKASKRKSIVKELSQILQQPWEKMSIEMGKLLMKNPALIHSVLKLTRSEKKVYIKFLSDNFQSVEGNVEVEL